MLSKTPPEARLVFFDHLSEAPYHLLVTSSNRFLKSKVMESILKNLKQLSIGRLDLVLVERLNHLTSLRQLEVDNFMLDKQHTLRLPNLEILSVEWMAHQLKLETSKLSSFRSGVTLDQFEFVYPESVTCLALNEYQPETRQFVNLRICYFGLTSKNEYCTIHKIPADLLNFLPQLDQIHLRDICKKSLIPSLLSSKNKLKRSNLKLYYCGLPIDTTREMGQYLEPEDDYLLHFNSDKKFDLVLDGYSELASILPFNTLVNFSDLVRRFDGQIENGLFRRFVNIQEVVVGEPIGDQKLFIWFPKQCKCLLDLELKRAGLNQITFYNRLPIHFPYLEQLKIEEEHELDLNFVPKLKWLRVFRATQAVSFSLISQTIRQCIRLYLFGLKLNNKPVDVFCLEHYEIRIKNADKEAIFKSKKKLLHFLKKCNVFDN